MFVTDTKVEPQIVDLTQRVLIVDAQPVLRRLLGDLLRAVSPGQIWTAADAAHGRSRATYIDPSMLVVGGSERLDGVAFVRSLRRSELACRRAPVIMISSVATTAAIIAARDAGVHEFLREPFALKDLVRRLEAIALRPRAWVEGMTYVGPDRRRFNSGDYAGELKRRVDQAATSNEARLLQALRILRASLLGLESNPRQALRAMRAQAGELASVAEAQGDAALLHDAAALRRALARLDPATLRREAVAPLIEPLLARMPAEDRLRRTA